MMVLTSFRLLKYKVTERLFLAIEAENVGFLATTFLWLAKAGEVVKIKLTAKVSTKTKILYTQILLHLHLRLATVKMYMFVSCFVRV